LYHNLPLCKIAANSTIKGFGVSIYTKDNVFYSKGFGYANKEEKIPYTINTVQKIASISKTLLGVSLIKAESLGLLKLDDPINEYLPFPLVNPHFPNSKITIRHLSTHTSGLEKSKYDYNALFFPTPIHLNDNLNSAVPKELVTLLNDNENLPMIDFLSKIYMPNGDWYTDDNFAKNKPGKTRIYSNNGAAFLALIIEKSSGIKYVDFVRKYILSPLEMHNTLFDFEQNKRSINQESFLYHGEVSIPNDYHLITYPAGGLLTNISDFSKFMIAMVKGYNEGNAILSQAECLEIMSKQIKPSFNQGILWEVNEKSIGHNGDIAGVTTYTYFLKEEGIGYILFCNIAASKNIDISIEEIKSTLKKYYTQFK